MGQHVVQGGVARGGGDRVAAEGGDAVAADAVEQVGAGHDAADGEAVAQALGERHRVRGDAVRGDAPEVRAGAAPAGLHLVGDQQDTVLVEDLLVRGEQPVGRHGEPAHALYRLGQQAADVGRVDAAGEQGLEVVHAGLDVVGVGQAGVGAKVPVGAVQIMSAERVVARHLPGRDTGHRDGAERASVIAPAHGEHLVGVARGEAGQQRGLVRLGAGVGEEDLRILDAGKLDDLLGQFDLVADEVQRRGVHDPGGDLPFDRVPDLGDVVAEHVGQDAGEEVKVAATLAVGDPAALAADDLDRLVVVDPDPVGDGRAMAGEKLRHAAYSPAPAAPLGPTSCHRFWRSPYTV